jgi:hypothetical protein
MQVGRPIAALETPKPVGYGIGLAVGLFGMEFIGGMLIYQATQIAAVQGCSLRAAVSNLLATVDETGFGVTHGRSWT